MFIYMIYIVSIGFVANHDRCPMRYCKDNINYTIYILVLVFPRPLPCSHEKLCERSALYYLYVFVLFFNVISRAQRMLVFYIIYVVPLINIILYEVILRVIIITYVWIFGLTTIGDLDLRKGRTQSFFFEL